MGAHVANTANSHQAFIADANRAIHATRLSRIRVTDSQHAGSHQACSNGVALLYDDLTIVEGQRSDDIRRVRHSFT
jgi:hypothetical protein